MKRSDMITNWNVSDESPSEQLLNYARAYLGAAVAVCEHMTLRADAHTWEMAAVANMLAAHSVELFFKGMIVGREPQFALGSHDIDYLIGEFKRRFPDAVLNENIPYRTIWVAEAPTDLESWRCQRTDPSLQFRYPFDRQKQPWIEKCVVEPQKFKEYLLDWNQEAERVAQLVAKPI